MKTNIALQCLLCIFLLIVSLIIDLRASQHTAQAGTNGITECSNNTFEDLSFNLFEEFFNE